MFFTLNIKAMKRNVFFSFFLALGILCGIGLYASSPIEKPESKASALLYQCPCPPYCSGGWLPASQCGSCSSLVCGTYQSCFGCNP